MVAIALITVLVLTAVAPAVQTWAAQKALRDRPGITGSLESLSAGFGEVDIEGLQLEANGMAITLPSLRAKLPITDAALRGKILIRSVVAKGWTLDLSRAAKPPGSQEPGVPAAAEPISPQGVARAFGGILSGWKLPFDVSLDGVELEGDVLFASTAGEPPARVHVVITGGGMSSGHEGEFAVETSTSAPGNALNGLAARGNLVVGMDSPRSVSRAGVKAALSGGLGLYQDLSLAAEVAAAAGAREESYALSLSRGGRQLVTLLARFPETTRMLEGTWNVDVRDSDLAPLLPDHPLPSISASGSGRFDVDAAFSRVHALGRLGAVAGRLGVLAPSLDSLGTVKLESSFDLARSGPAIRVDRLSVALGDATPAVVVQSLQAFDFDGRTGDLTVVDPRADWLGASVRALPLAWLSGLAGGRAIAGGDASGEFAIRAAGGEFTLRPKTPLSAAGVSIKGAGGTLASELDLSLLLEADYSPRGWEARWAPFAASGGGKRLVTVDGNASRAAGADQQVAFAGTWSAVLEAIAARQAVPMLSGIAGHSASGDFSGSLGATRKVEGTLLVTGRLKGNSIAASVHAEASGDGAVAFTVPVKVSTGASVSELSATGTWVGDATGNWVDAKVTGGSVALEHLLLLAGPLAALGGVPIRVAPEAVPAAPSGARDTAPFWGDWTGHVSVALDRLRTADREFGYVGGVFDIDRGSIQMEGGRGSLERHLVTNMTGSISFDATAVNPYSAKAAAALDDLDAAPLFGPPKSGQDPLLEGHFSVKGTLTGNGANLDDLLGRTQEEFRFTCTAGIVRLLRANVAESLPEVSSPVSDTLGSVGFVVGSVLGIKKDSMSAGKDSVSKTGDAVLNFTYQVAEIGFDKAAVTAIRRADGTIRLVDIEMTAPEEHLKGSGQIDNVMGLPITQEPLSVELRLGARGRPAELLSQAGLLSPAKDGLGYALLNESIRFGGTLEHIDESQWNALLVKAATRKPETVKKGG